MVPSSFRARLACVAVAGLVLRVVIVLTVASRNPDGGDPLYYHLQGNLLADGEGFVHPFTFTSEGRSEPSAVHPPLFSLVLAVASLLGGRGFLAHKLTMVLAGTLTVVVVGLVARRLAGDRAGLLAAAVAAVYPNLWAPEGILMPEALFGLLVAAALLAAYRFRATPGWREAAVLGGACGLAALARSEGILLVGLLVVPLALTARPLGWRRQAAVMAVGVAGAVVVVAPWTIRNLARFDRPVLLSVSGDEVVGYANCDQTYHGDLLGFWFFWCNQGDPPGDEAERGAFWRDRGVDYARDHAGRLPVVVAARVGRVWDVYRPLQGAQLNTIEGRARSVTRAGLAAYAVLLPTAGAGAVVLGRRRGWGSVWPLAAQAVLVTVTAAYAYGVTRFRMPAEVAIVVLAGVALDAALTRRQAGASRAPARP